jgi:glycosyltransferase involved in cell wall biosynthesis
LAFIRKPEERKYLSSLDFLKVRTVYRGKRLDWPYVLKYITGKSLLLSSYENTEMRRLINQEINAGTYDLVHLEPFYVIPSLPGIKIPLVVAEHNVEYRVYEEYAESFRFPPLIPFLKLEAGRIEQAEIAAVKKADHVITVSRSDAEVLSRFIGKSKISVVPNGVDTDYFPYIKRSKTDKPVFLFVGNFYWLPNRELLHRLVRDIWPAIHAAVPRARLRIVGQSIPTDIKAVAEGNFEFAENIADIRTEYAKADVLLSPVSIAGGTKYKILEAMASGLPVLTTPEGITGLDVRQDEHVLVAGSADEYPVIAKELITRPPKIGRITENARRLVLSTYSWERIMESLDRAWQITYEKSKN